MLELFKRNTFFSILLLIPYASILHIGSWLVPIPQTMSEQAWLYRHTLGQLPQTGTPGVLLSILLIVIQAGLLGRIVSQYKLNPDGQLFGSLFFILFCGFHFSTLSVNPVLFANVFFTFGINELFKLYARKSVALPLYNFGFFIGLAAAIYPAYYIYILLGVFGITVLRGIGIREVLQLIGGFLNVFALLFAVLYLLDLHQEYWNIQIAGYFSPYAFSMNIQGIGWVAFGLLILFLLICLGHYQFFQNKRGIQVQKQIDLLFWALLGSLLSLFFLEIDQVSHLTVLFTPLCLLCGLWITRFKNPLISETIHLFLVISSLFLQFQNW
ncbi:MAG TPA: hypothetical protein VFX48_03105 [Saprospiraceae bacterium]|nr:hypothetical protein [Saprospiraceae bacterium]